MDLEYLLYLQHLREISNGLFDSFFENYSLLVIQKWFFFLVAGIYWCCSKKLGEYMFFNMAGSHIMTVLLKNTFCIYRPWMRNPAIVPVGDAISTANGYSFPSGHSSIATATFGSPAVWFRKHRWFVVIMSILIALVLFSRNYLGVHTPQDVIVGCGATCLCLYANWKMLKWANAAPNRDYIVLGGGTVLTAAAMLFLYYKSYPTDLGPNGQMLIDPVKGVMASFGTCGMFWGLLVGWVAERHFVRFSTDVHWGEKIARFIGGGALLYVVSSYLKEPSIALLGDYFGRFACQFALIFSGVFLWPLAFEAVHKLVLRNLDKKALQNEDNSQPFQEDSRASTPEETIESSTISTEVNN